MSASMSNLSRVLHSHIHIGQLLTACIGSTVHSGRIIRKIYKEGRLNVQNKGEGDPQTQADITSQKYICDSLKQVWPTLQIVGEESVLPKDIVSVDPVSQAVSLNSIDCLTKLPSHLQRVPLEQVCVFVDPLDATAEFTRGELKHVTTLIGISVNGRPVAGVIHAPFEGVDMATNQATIASPYVFGLIGVGCFGSLLHSGDCEKLRNSEDWTICTTKSRRSERLSKALEILNPAKTIRVGGAGYKGLLLLQKQVHLYIHPMAGLKKWDTCAVDALIKASGGKVTDCYGKDIVYGKAGNHTITNGLLAAWDPELHKNALNQLQRDVFFQPDCVHSD